MNTLTIACQRTIALIALFFLWLTPLAHADDFATLSGRIHDQYIYLANTSEAQSYVQSMSADGTWSDVNYADTSESYWSPMTHLWRVRVIAATASKDSNASLAAAANRSMGWFLDRNPRSSNWWYNDIGTPQRLGEAAILLGDALDSSLVPKLSARLPTTIPWFPFAPGTTGSNRSDRATAIVYGGVIDRDAARITRGADILKETLPQTTDEGLQHDFSYLLHGQQFMTSNYGEEWAKKHVNWVSAFAGGRWAYSDAQIQLLVGFELEGWWPVSWKGRMDHQAHGRGLIAGGSNTGRPEQYRNLTNYRSAELQQMAEEQTSGVVSDNAGFKYFWRAGYGSMRAQDYFLSIRMASNVIENTESDNGQNPHCYACGLGSTYLYTSPARHADYGNSLPAWHFGMIPGTTMPRREVRISDDYTKFPKPNSASFVGGVDAGKTGVMAMDFASSNQIPGIYARKAWFVFDDVTVALGSSIRGSDSAGIYTTVDQILLRGAVSSSGGVLAAGESAVKDLTWIHHSDVGYYFPQAWDGLVAASTRTGSWAKVDANQSTAPVTRDIFALAVNHGTNPNWDTYAYAVLPNRTAAQTSAYAASPSVEILVNTTALQAVYNRSSNKTGVVFYQAGSLTLEDGLVVRSDRAAIVQIDRSTSPIKAYVAVPNGQGVVRLTFESPTDGTEALSITLPTATGMVASTASSQLPVGFAAQTEGRHFRQRKSSETNLPTARIYRR